MKNFDPVSQFFPTQIQPLFQVLVFLSQAKERECGASFGSTFFVIVHDLPLLHTRWFLFSVLVILLVMTGNSKIKK